MELQNRRRECGIEQEDLARRVGTNAPMMSNFERYKCIPIPSMLQAICNELQCSVDDIYKRSEIYIALKPQETEAVLEVKGKTEPEIYKFSVRLPNSAREVFSRKNLEKCGYHSLKDFVWHCYKRFEKQLELVDKKEKATKHSNCSMAHESGL